MVHSELVLLGGAGTGWSRGGDAAQTADGREIDVGLAYESTDCLANGRGALSRAATFRA